MAISPKPMRKHKRVERRGTAAERGYGHKWRVASAAWIAANPSCGACGLIDIRSRMVVDHIKPHRGCMQLFWDRSNWETLCKTCHNQKTARGR
jgi:5-methylcytosine-specific restriction enzyme A